MTGLNISDTFFTGPITSKIAVFLMEIGLEIRPEKLDTSTFLPGIEIKNGTLLVDEDKLKYPGDLLHEAGHLAVMEPELRKQATGDLEPGDDMKQNSLELAAIAWSYAAAVNLGIDLKEVFHDEGYRGSADAYIDNFQNGRYVGVPLLQWKALTTEAAFPAMTRWIV
jgi:hypothetical protein